MLDDVFLLSPLGAVLRQVLFCRNNDLRYVVEELTADEELGTEDAVLAKKRQESDQYLELLQQLLDFLLLVFLLADSLVVVRILG